MEADELVVGPERERPDPPLADRDTTEPGEESRTIGRLADELLPTLIAHLDASGLGELEVRGQGWRVRLRKPYDRRQTVAPGERRHRQGPGSVPPRTGTAPSRGSGHAVQPHTRAAGDAVSPTSATTHPAGDPTGNGRPHPEEATAQERPAAQRSLDPAEPATSPVVGYFSPRDTLSIGRRVRAGDIVGWVDCLGIRQEVVSPVDGVVATILAETGEAVEYGQHLVRVVPGAPGASPGAAASSPASAGGTGS